MQRQRQSAVGDGGMRLEAEQFLHPDVQGRRALAIVVDRMAVAGRRFEVRRRLGFEPLLEAPRNQALERLAERIGAYVRQSRLPGEKGCEPVGDMRRKGRVGQIRPDRFAGSPAPRRKATRSRNCSCAFVHGSRPTPIEAMPLAKSRAVSSAASMPGVRRAICAANGSLANVIASSLRTLRARTAAASRSNVSSSLSVMRSAAIRNTSASSVAAARRMRVAAAAPCISATTRNGTRARGSTASRRAPRPLASTK